jgi:sigma-B regulation protein RsbU (phosphoserine phosphatase)
MPEDAFCDGDERRRLRHSVRTHLNHLAGYAEILRQESADGGEDELASIYDQIRGGAFGLRDLAFSFFPDTADVAPSPEAIAEGERNIYGLLYDIIEKILEAANSIVELFETRLSSRVAEADATGPRAYSERLESAELPPAARSGRILVVDDNQFNRELLVRHLERQGHAVSQVSDGLQALETLRESPFDLVIMDIMMPGMNGYQLLEALRADEDLADIYVIVISALDDTQGIARCIQLGAEDYLPREFEPVILRARIESCLEKRSLKAKEKLYIAAVRESERSLNAGLSEGAEYVRGLLPPRLDLPGLESDWVFIPSRSLGGDVFGYHRLSDGRFVMYLLDVSGHGIGAALYSVTLMNILKNQALPATDFGDPASVLSRLNAAFQMEDQNNLYFTAWYGVWDASSRLLVYASAGGPPAILVTPGGGLERLETDGPAVGIDEASLYATRTESVPPSSRLYLFSDGAYEIVTRDSEVLGLDAFIGILAGANAGRYRNFLGGLMDLLLGLSATGRFDDDVSLVEVRLG